jgi:hypothetical protein
MSTKIQKVLIFVIFCRFFTPSVCLYGSIHGKCEKTNPISAIFAISAVNEKTKPIAGLRPEAYPGHPHPFGMRLPPDLKKQSQFSSHWREIQNLSRAESNGSEIRMTLSNVSS